MKVQKNILTIQKNGRKENESYSERSEPVVCEAQHVVPHSRNCGMARRKIKKGETYEKN